MANLGTVRKLKICVEFLLISKNHRYRQMDVRTDAPQNKESFALYYYVLKNIKFSLEYLVNVKWGIHFKMSVGLPVWLQKAEM